MFVFPLLLHETASLKPFSNFLFIDAFRNTLLQTGEWYTKQIQDFAPCFALIHNIMKDFAMQDGAEDAFIPLCSWMHQPEVVRLCHQLLYSVQQDDINSHECLLIVTAAMERALGNVH